MDNIYNFQWNVRTASVRCQNFYLYHLLLLYNNIIIICEEKMEVEVSVTNSILSWWIKSWEMSPDNTK